MTEAPTPSEPDPAPPTSAWRETLELVRTVVIGLMAALTVHAVLWQPFTIPSSSMEPGLTTGDYIVVNKFAYGWSSASLPFNSALFGGRLFGRDPARGDVVVFRLPRDPQQTWVKRVIGLPGDRVQVRDGGVFVNGRPLPQRSLGMGQDLDAPDRMVRLVRETQPNGRRYITYDGGPGQPGDDTAEFVVPQRQYFMMGDNRDNSLDSRWPGEVGVGLLPARNIMGRADLIVASWRPGASLFKPWTWANLKPGRLLRPVA